MHDSELGKIVCESALSHGALNGNLSVLKAVLRRSLISGRGVDLATIVKVNEKLKEQAQ